MVIELTPDLEQALTEEADRRGTNPETLALDTLRARFARPAEPEHAPQAANLAEYLKDYIGAVDSSELIPGGAQMSTDTGKKFTELLLERRGQGRL